VKVNQFFTDVKAEVKKVDWPTRDRITKLTIVVLLVVIALTIFTFVLDIGFGNILFK
jgi:preprotein translocase subunit SecE